MSRSLYRELAPMLADSAGTAKGRDDREYLLAACDATMRRLLFEPQTRGGQARSLFRQIRDLFPLGAQAEVWCVVRFHAEAGRSLAVGLEAMLRRQALAATPPEARHHAPAPL